MQDSLDETGDARLFHDHCPKHGGATGLARSSSSDDVIIGSVGGPGERMMLKETSSTLGLTVGSGTGVESASVAMSTDPVPNRAPQTAHPGSGNGGTGPATAAASQGPATSGSSSKKHDPKEIMKKRRERAICIDRVSRVIFPSTFILLNIIYWLVFSEILETIQSTTGLGIGSSEMH